MNTKVYIHNITVYSHGKQKYTLIISQCASHRVRVGEALLFLERLDHYLLDRAPVQDDTTYHRSIATTGETEAGTVDVETDQGLEIGIVDVHLAVHQGAVQIPTQRAFFKVSADASTCPRPSFFQKRRKPN
ncbi:hypothetical protein OUZ56_033188 [Daphnia magna]|uniref:Uncharacterized protein n=1 Tax=Daphnia magna TaxID=35525 RepID=A0ABQ9ZYC4_9CRUS|nr:hypothetical protein OUZ56_033188 [Daphnia magna]